MADKTPLPTPLPTAALRETAQAQLFEALAGVLTIVLYAESLEGRAPEQLVANVRCILQSRARADQKEWVRCMMQACVLAQVLIERSRE